jgi:Putative auto-transporter adhesin, head GIN domain
MKQIIITILLLLPVMMVSAQKGPLTGSGKLMSNTYDVKPFTKIKFIDLAGKGEVEVGKPFAVAVDIDDNLAYLLSVSCEEGVLKIAFNDNQNNRLYIENTNIRIKIALPALNTLEHRGNNRVEVTGLADKHRRTHHQQERQWRGGCRPIDNAFSESAFVG